MSMEKYTLLIVGEKGKSFKSRIIKKLIDEGSISKSESNSDENPVTRSFVTCEKGKKFILEITESNYDSVKKLQHLKFDYVLHIFKSPYYCGSELKSKMLNEINENKKNLLNFVNDEQRYHQAVRSICDRDKYDEYGICDLIFNSTLGIWPNKYPNIVRCDEYGKPYDTDIVKLNNRVSKLEAELKTKSEQLMKVKSMLVPTL